MLPYIHAEAIPWMRGRFVQSPLRQDRLGNGNFPYNKGGAIRSIARAYIYKLSHAKTTACEQTVVFILIVLRP